jgi:hypothetical protein
MAKEPESKQERRPLFTADELAVARFVYIVHIRLFIQSEPKVAPAILFYPLSWLIILDGQAVCTSHF